MQLKPTITYDQFVQLDLRVATVLSAQHHPNADRLLKLQVDLGGEQRQICAGIKAFYDPPSALVGKQIVVVANLQPRTIRGEPSNGMLLAASSLTPGGESVGDLAVLEITKPLPPGSSVG